MRVLELSYLLVQNLLFTTILELVKAFMESSVVTACFQETYIHTEIHIKLCGVLASRRRVKRQMKIRLDLFTLEERGGKDLRNVYKLFPTFHQLWLQFHQDSGAQGEPIARK